MRAALIWLLLCMGVWAQAADILILVHEEEVSSAIPLDGYVHPTWILWPKAVNLLQSNRLFSLASGVDWQTGFLDDVFVVYAGQARNTSVEKWRRRGFFDAAQRNIRRQAYAIAPMVPPSESGNPVRDGPIPEEFRPSKELLKMALHRPDAVPILGRKDPWPEDALIVAEARGQNPWDEVAFLVDKAGGRALVVEYPSESATMWSRFWLQGRGWQEGAPVVPSTRIPGLIPARNLLALLDDPTTASWSNENASPPNRWLVFGHESAPVALVFLTVAAVYVMGLGIYCVLREQYSRIALGLIRLLITGPAALLLGGQLASLFGLNLWMTWHVVALGLVGVASWIVDYAVSRWGKDFHPLWGEFAVGALVCAACDPVWSMFSNVLGPHRAPTSPEAFGALAGYLFGSVALAPVRAIRLTGVWIALWAGVFIARPQWLLGFSITASLVWGLTVGSCFFPLGWRRPLVLPAVLVASLICALYKPGLAYMPQGLAYSYAQVGKFNCAEQIAFLLSPTFISFCILAIIAGIVGDNFLGHQARRAMAFSPLPKAFFWAGLCFLAAGVFVPLYLHAFLATAIAGAVAVLFDAIRSP